MEDFNSKYTGEQVEELLDMVANGEVGGGIEAETDPIFSASPAASITDVKKAEWDGKQDAIADLATIREGASKGATALQSVPSEYGTKAWVTEQARDIANDAVGDFEAVAVEPLAEEVLQLKGAIGNKVDKVTGKGLSAEDFTSEFKSKLEALSNYDDTELSNAISTLRGDFNKLVSGDTTTAIKTFNEVIAFLDGITDSEDLAGIIASIEQQIAGKMDNVTLAKVATSGSYNDLSNKPTIPSAVTESTVSGWGFTKNTGSYSKPTGGIPKNDLSSAVQASLDKADAAVPVEILYDSVYAHANGIADDQFAYALPSSANGGEDDIIATRNSLKTINGESLVGSGDITISGGATLTEADIAAMGFTKNTGTYSKPDNGIPKSDLAYGVQQILSNAVVPEHFGDLGYINTGGFCGITSETLYALPHEGTGDEDDILLSRSTLKTINGESLFGSGDITISGGSGGTSGGGKEFVEIEPDFSPAGYEGFISLAQMNKIYVSDKPLIIMGVAELENGIEGEVSIHFVADALGCTLSLPEGVIWADGKIPDSTLTDCYCELSIVAVKNINTYIYKAVLSTIPYGHNVVLQAGDNGQIGIDTYNYMVNHGVTDSVGTIDWTATIEDNIFLNADGLVNQRLEGASISPGDSDRWFSLYWPSQGWWIAYLQPDGYLNIEYDD